MYYFNNYYCNFTKESVMENYCSTFLASLLKNANFTCVTY